MSTVVTTAHLAAGMAYEDYLSLIDALLASGRTTGSDHSPSKLDLTRLNLQRMQRLDRTIALLPELQTALAAVREPWTWVVLVEAWCGDGAQNLPLIAAMAKASPFIDLKILLRDEYPEIIDAYRTDGARSIPRLIALCGTTLDVIGTWGPRPAQAQALLHEFRNNPDGRTREEFNRDLHLWYARNRTLSQQREFAGLLGEWCCGCVPAAA